MRLRRVDFDSTDAQGNRKWSETIAGRQYLRFIDLDLDAVGEARCNRIVPRSALTNEDWGKALHHQPLDVAELVSYGPYIPQELSIERKHVQDILNAERQETP